MKRFPRACSFGWVASTCAAATCLMAVVICLVAAVLGSVVPAHSTAPPSASLPGPFVASEAVVDMLSRATTETIAGDFDDDSDIDVLSLDVSTHVVTLYRNRGDGTFEPTIVLNAPRAPTGVQRIHRF